MSSNLDGTGSWFVPMIGMNDAGQLSALSWNWGGVRVTGPFIPAYSWTHVVSTYHLTNGLRLYINGSFYNASSPFSFHGSQVTNYLCVGSSRLANNDSLWVDIVGQYSGAVDELQVYSRELTGGEINALTNPGP